VLLVVGWFISGGNAPDYTAADQDWTEWADDNQWKSRIGGFLILLAGFLFLHFAATIRTADTAQRRLRALDVPRGTARRAFVCHHRCWRRFPC
jgi:hypothetical protein